MNEGNAGEGHGLANGVATHSIVFDANFDGF